jgi:hypothetical protein
MHRPFRQRCLSPLTGTFTSVETEETCDQRTAAERSLLRPAARGGTDRAALCLPEHLWPFRLEGESDRVTSGMGALAVTRMKLIVLVTAIAPFWHPCLQADDVAPHTTKICQLTGEEDRQPPGKPTGSVLGGETGGVTGTDLGFPFEYNRKLYFLFGDSREFPPDRCEPAWCGTENEPIDVLQPDPNKVQRWRSNIEWGTWERIRGEGSDSMATAPLTFDPEHCIPLKFEAVGDNSVFAHEVVGNTIAPAFQLGGPNVAGNPQDKWVLVMGNRILVVTQEGDVFVHEVSGNTVGVPFRLGGPKVAANPQDKWLLVMGNRLLVVTDKGDVFVHEVSGNTVGVPFRLGGPKVAANWQDIRVLVMGNRLLVGTARRFRPTRLNGKVVGRDEGAIGAFTDGRIIYSFFTLRDKPLGCLAALPGCPHGGEEPGGKSVLSMSVNGGRNFKKLMLVSKTKFLWTVPEVTQASSVPGLPAHMTGQVVLVWGAGREKNALDPQVDGRVFTHEVSGNTVGVPFRLGGPKVAANPQDKSLLVMGNRLLVVTKDGRVFTHEVIGNTVGVPFRLGGPMVAANPQDKWLLVMGNRLLVVTGIPVSRWNHSYPFLAVAPLSSVKLKDSWRYFAGLKENGQPDWQESEALAQPLPPSDPLLDGKGYHQCLGYFSVRFIAGWRKWAMMYTCNNNAEEGYNIANGERGIYLRTAATPWGPWSTPQRIFNPDEAYCYFMHDQRGDESDYCNGKGTNPAEESVRDTRTPVTKRGAGGEYAPILLPSRYAKVGPDRTTLYFLVATWNPYQVVLMRTEVSPSP